MLQKITDQFTKGGTGLTDGTLSSAVKELQGLNMTVFAGAASGTKMNVDAIRPNDTIVAAIVSTDAGGALADDKANITIQSTKASGTLTISGDPANDETFVVNGATYTFKTTLSSGFRQVKITAGNYSAMAAAVASAVNAYETRRLSGIAATGINEAQVVATSAAGVVTITSVADGVGNAPVVSGTVSVLAATGSGTASATLTPVTVVAGNTCIVNGVTFTAAVAPVGALEFPTKATAVTDLGTGIALAGKINAYEASNGTLDVVATAHETTGVVTIVPKSAFKGNIITLTENAAGVAASGSGTLAGGIATGGIKSTSNLADKSVILCWFKKA